MKKLSFFAVLAILIIPAAYHAQGWSRTYGGQGQDVGYHIESTNDGGYIITGSTTSFEAGGSDLWLLKLNSEGYTVWTKTYGGERDDQGNWVEQTPDGGFIVTARTRIPDEGWAVWLLKTDANGDTLWTKTYLYERTYIDDRSVVQQAEDGGYIIIATDVDFYYTHPWVIKTDQEGEVEWSVLYDSYEFWIGIISGRITSDGGCIIAASRFLIKIDPEGNVVWSTSLGGDKESVDVEQTSDGGFIVAGTTRAIYGEDSQCWMMKTDSAGNVLWEKSYNGNGQGISLNPHGSVKESTDGGFILTGTFIPRTGWLLKTDYSGDSLWARTYGGEADDLSFSLTLSQDGGYAMVGYTNSFSADSCDLWVLQTDSDGRIPLEVTPTEIISPVEDTVTGYAFIKAVAEYTNFSTEDAADFYLQCHLGSNQVVHRKSIRVMDTLYAWRSRVDTIDKWIVLTDPGDYAITFSAYNYSPDPLKCRPKTHYFTIPGEEAVEESPAVTPTIEVLSSIGDQVMLRYSGYREGFSAEVFDASGRSVDVIEAEGPSGSISWGGNHGAGVYFVRPIGGEVSTQKVILIE